MKSWVRGMLMTFEFAKVDIEWIGKKTEVMEWHGIPINEHLHSRTAFLFETATLKQEKKIMLLL